MRVKPPRPEADHPPPPSADVKKEWSYISASPVRLHGVVLSLKNTGIILSLPLLYNGQRQNLQTHTSNILINSPIKQQYKNSSQS
jgi:hypothetical protein